MRAKVVWVAVIAATLGAYAFFTHRPFPSDRTPEGAYVRIALSLSNGRPRDMFAYLETEAQWASYTVRDMRKKAVESVATSYPEPQKSELLARYGQDANTPNGPETFATLAERKGWLDRLRRDLSGVKKVDESGERATVETARGTRYSFRKRDNGIWGLTLFTAELLAEAQKATRDVEIVKAAAADYEASSKR